MLNYLVILRLTTFFRCVEKLSKIELNKRIAPFMSHLRKFYLNANLAFVHNNLLHEFGIEAADIKLISKGNDREYFSSNFERILSKFSVHSPCVHCTRIGIQALLHFHTSPFYTPLFAIDDSHKETRLLGGSESAIGPKCMRGRVFYGSRHG